ncbi:hypothetical protein GGF50DRAFT_128984 [Schizophyllum commune]
MDPSTARIKIERLREHYVRKYAKRCSELLQEHRAEFAAEASLLLQGSSTSMCTKAMSVQRADEIEQDGVDSSLVPKLIPTLKSVFGHQHLYPVQEHCLRPGCTLVISPTISLVLDQLHIARRLQTRIVIDEAHCVADMGHKFRASYSKLDVLRDLCPDVPVLCLTATCTRKSWAEISRVLKLGPLCDVAKPRNTLFLSAPLERPNLLYHVVPKPRLEPQLTEAMAHLILNNYPGQSGIIYCPTKVSAVTVSGDLAMYSDGRIKASFFHSEVKSGDKARRYGEWMRGEIHVMCATAAFGLGINKRDVRFVMHHTTTLEQYFQESGRAGRDNLPSACILYHKAQDAANAAGLIKTGQSGLNDRAYFLEAGVQTQAGVRSSGQSQPEADCGRCDNRTRAEGAVRQRGVAGDAWLILQILQRIHAQGKRVTLKELAEICRGMARTDKVVFAGMKRKRSGSVKRPAVVDLRRLGGAVSPYLSQDDCERLIVQLFIDGYLDGFLYTTTYKKFRNQYLYMKLGPLARRLMICPSRDDVQSLQITQRYVVDAGRRRVRQRITEVPVSTGTSEDSSDVRLDADETEEEATVVAMVIEDEDEDIFSWSDTLQAFTSCVPCLRPGTPAEDDNPHDPTRNRVRRARPDELESLLADADSTDTEAETLSLHSNPGEGRRRRKKRKARNITLCGVDLFGKRRQAIQLPEDDGALFDSRRASTTTSATFDSDAASLDPSDLTHISPAELERRALEEEERRQKEERRRRRRERREMRRVAEAIAAGELHDGEVPGYEGYVDTQPAPAARMSASRRLSVDAFGPFQQAPSPVSPQDEADDTDAADLDGGLYAGRRRAQGGSSVSGSRSGVSSSRSGGSDSRSRTSASQPDAQADLPPPPKQKRKKSKSGKASSSSKSSRSRASDTSASTTQSPSLVSPHAASFTGALPPVYAISEHPASPTEGDFDGVVGMGLDSAPAQAYTSAELKPSAEFKPRAAGGLHVDVNGLTPTGALPSAALATGMPSPGLRTGMPSPGLGADMPSPGLPSPGLGGGPRRQSNARDMGAFLASK